MKKTIKLLFLLFLSTNLSGQIPFSAEPKPWIKVNEKTDSIVSLLKTNGVDTMIVYSASKFYHQVYHSESGMDDYNFSVIIWKKNDSIFVKKINDYYESQPKLANYLNTVFDFYQFNKDEIDSTRIAPWPKKGKLGAYSTHDNSYSFYYKIFDTERSQKWSGIHLKAYNSDSNNHMKAISTKLYSLSIIIENEIMKMNFNESWKPIRIEYYSEEEDVESVKKMIIMMEKSIIEAKEFYNIE